ncbi:hypothetical protein [Ruminococcus sp. HUN007]|uniref:hypothetical protein n=1 Tax=Ruminococcus sp. HUN007 TaxID=1514668 RepID=UPI0005D27807|nr:hypothetical protein [Ruminococcus sp. HUN007]
MNKKSENTTQLSEINDSIKSLEQMIKLMLINNVIDQINIDNDCSDYNNSNSISELKSSFTGIISIHESNVFSHKVFIVKTDSKTKINEIKKIYVSLKENGVCPVFRYEQLNGMKRKRLIEEKISFYDDKQIMIFSF